MSLVQYKISSPLGALFLVASTQGLVGVYWSKRSIKLITLLDRSQPAEKILADAEQQLNEYFVGKRKRFDIAFDLTGTVFQRKVWAQLSNIPWGQTISYAELAKCIKSPKAFRAVGSANGKNPLCILIPCHRVISADGSIGGYSGGITKKRQLLQLERG